jgi:hypothetical protein
MGGSLKSLEILIRQPNLLAAVIGIEDQMKFPRPAHPVNERELSLVLFYRRGLQIEGCFP